MPTPRVVLSVVLWPAVAFTLGCVGVIAWCAWVSEDVCECVSADRFADGECKDCGRAHPACDP